MNIITTSQRYFTGYDFFISYSRLDCSEYASNLANKIIEQKYSCYLDQWGSQPGKELPNSLKRKLKNSSVLILLGSEASLLSNAIEEEINIFEQTKKIIIPVELCNITEASWFKIIDGTARSNEKINFKNNIISETLLTRIKNSLNYTRQSSRIRNSIVLFIFLMILSIGSLSYLFSKRKEIEKVNLSLNDSIKIRTKELVNIEKELSSKEESLQSTNDSLKQTKDHLDITSSDLSNTVDSLKKKGVSLNNITAELFVNKEKLAETDKGLMTSQERVNNFTNKTLNSYEPPFNVECECLKKEHIILFDVESDKLKPIFKNYLSKLLICLKKNKSQIELIGYDRENYSNSYALNLSERRASSVATYLKENGYDGSNIRAIGRGNSEKDKKLLDLVGLSRVELIIQ
ncbi:TIR domain-containing protein [Kaistella sp. G5-32]|uniref:TIR domain-containing protein n=1 Tax=Kaistella gelatinilytica TaxID=2787636 RepID=A0ABS0FAI7_9FLAO|nr:TIR domain-containing protein [Kaistella gelatinilytica]MBF8456718.1 TIR domain-containing protein [Kaistella gelatinilytica]